MRKIEKELFCVFDFCRDAVICLKDNKIVYRNSRALALFPDIDGKLPGDILPELLLEYDGEKFLGSVRVGERDINVIVSLSGQYKVVYFINSGGAEPGADKIADAACIKLSDNIAVLKICSDILGPYIENNGDDKMVRYNRIVIKAVYTLQRIIGNILYLRTAEQEKMSPVYMDMVSALRDVVDTTCAIIKEDGPRITFETDAKEIISYADRDKIEFAVMQVLSNSLKYTPKDGKIEVKLRLVGDKITITVTDNGRGIPDDVMVNLWSAGSVSTSDGAAGAGLGFAIVQSIARLHGGGAVIESLPDKGTSVTVSIPVKKLPYDCFSDGVERYDSGMSRYLIQFADVLPAERFTEKFMD
jgi:anti-sigma regulatory factor (Ser/Thr protein kinase)